MVIRYGMPGRPDRRPGRDLHVPYARAESDAGRGAEMPDPLVETKLLLPEPRRALVPRPRLADLLQRGADAPITLVSAPAGFGKTTLLSGWLAARARGTEDGEPVAWVSLDERDRVADVVLDLRPPGPRPRRPGLRRCRAHAAAVRAGARSRPSSPGVVNELSVYAGRGHPGPRRLPPRRRRRRRRAG